MDGLLPEQFQISFNPLANKGRYFKEDEINDGHYSFITKDQKFCVEIIQAKSLSRLLQFLGSLVNHYFTTNNESVLARIYGIFTIETNVFGTFTVIVMQNTLKTYSRYGVPMAFNMTGNKKRRVEFEPRYQKWWKRIHFIRKKGRLAYEPLYR